uniref:Uncharacterized protein n=1 Tax=Arundo donax TaxID=35708 RepID=A0A0A9C7N5_ARUDO
MAAPVELPDLVCQELRLQDAAHNL